MLMGRKKSFKLITALFLTIFMVSIMGCGSKGENAKEKEPKKLVIGVGRDFYEGPKSDDYLHGSTNVWESLTYIDKDLNAVPMLAESWNVSKDGKTWTFHLRKGVKFHDDSEFNAKAAVKNMERLLYHPKKGNTKSIYGDVESIKAIDDNTIEFKHKNPVPNFPNKIAYDNSLMFSLDSFDEKGDIKKPIGTGPYKYKEHKKDDVIVLEKSSKYWRGTPKIDQVVFKCIVDPNTRAAALEKGEVDVLADVGAIMPEQAENIKKNDKIELKTQPVITTHYLHFNKNKIFKDNNLLQAVSASIDRENLVKKLMHGYASPAQSVITPLAQKWVNKEATPKYDMEKAKELASKSLNGKNETITILLNSKISSRWPYKSIAEIFQQQWKQLGLDVKIEMVDGGLWSERLKKGDYDITLAPFTIMSGEPNSFFSQHMLSTGSDNKLRSYGYNNPEADKLIRLAASEMDNSKRKAMYDKLQVIASNEGPLVPLFHDVSIYAVNKKVKNFTLDHSFRADLYGVDISK